MAIISADDSPDARTRADPDGAVVTQIGKDFIHLAVAIIVEAIANLFNRLVFVADADDVLSIFRASGSPDDCTLANASCAWLIFEHPAGRVGTSDDRAVWIVIAGIDRIWHAIVITVAIVGFPRIRYAVFIAIG